MKDNEVILHGEAMIFKSLIPATARLKKIESPFIVIANSETTGNDHVVDVVDGVEFYEGEDKTLYMESSARTQVRCLHEERHDTIEIPAGTYEFGIQTEYDPFTARLQQVRD